MLLFKGDASKCVELTAGNTDNGTPIIINTCNNAAQQQWTYHPLKSGYIRYSADLSKCIDLTGGSTENGNKLQIWDCIESDNQRWWGGGAFQFQSAIDSTKCIDLYAGDTTSGKPLEIWDCITGNTESSDGKVAAAVAAAAAAAASHANTSAPRFRGRTSAKHAILLSR
jgi:hypothetical protein